MRKRRYEILLPLKFNDGLPVPSELFEQTREELVARFDVSSSVSSNWTSTSLLSLSILFDRAAGLGAP